MPLNGKTIRNKLISHLQSVGGINFVGKAEPRNQPGRGLTAAVFLSDVGPVPDASGLAATSMRVVYMVRLYTAADMRPDVQDDEILDATDGILEALNGDFSLGNNVMGVDVLGAYGSPVTANAGYLNYQDTLYRSMTISVPLIVTDVWAQVS